MAKEQKYVYTFGAGKAEGDASMRNLLGGKGANLAEMTNIGLPVPAGFTIGTNVCTYYYAHDRTYPPRAEQSRRIGDGQGRKGDGGQVRRRPRTRCWSPAARAPASRCPA